jgi:hypothetical protein
VTAGLDHDAKALVESSRAAKTLVKRWHARVKEKAIEEAPLRPELAQPDRNSSSSMSDFRNGFPFQAREAHPRTC